MGWTPCGGGFDRRTWVIDRPDNSYREEVREMDKLLQAIRTIPGAKIVTLVKADGDVFTVDIQEDGSVGYEPAHEALFCAKLLNAVSDGGALVIRQFLDEKVEIDGRMLPRKNVYGVALGAGRWHGMTAMDVRESYTVDYETGKPVKPEHGVSYCKFPTD
jgi:hypothetical protein